MTRAELIEALKSAKGPNPSLDLAVYRVCPDYSGSIHLTTSLDAAISLVERVRPGWVWTATRYGDGAYKAGVCEEWPKPSRLKTAEAPTPALALLIALLESMEAEPA